MLSLFGLSTVVVDSDGTELDEKGYCTPSKDKSKIKQKFEKYGIDVHILKRREIENYLISEYIRKYFEEEYEIDIGDIAVSPCIDVVETVDDILRQDGIGKDKLWSKNKADITPRLFAIMLKNKKVPLEFKEILEKAIRKCGFESKFSDDFEYI